MSTLFKLKPTLIGLAWCASWVMVSAAELARMPETRIALVIGNSDYASAPLKNPVNDVRLLKSTLGTLGFEVLDRTDLDAQGMRTAIRDFTTRLQQSPGSVGLFYFAGHGVQFKGVNYLLPIGNAYASETDVEDLAVNAETVVRRIQESGAKLSFVVLDACRNNPFAKTASRSLGMLVGGLARMNPPSGALIAYSTAAGSVASDGSDSNGLYTQHLVRNMKVPGISAEQMFKRTREGVELASQNMQSPREESSLKGADFMFLPVSEGRKVNPELIELTYWETIRSSLDASDFETYLRDYPQGKYASLAKKNLAKARQLAVADPGLTKAGNAHADKSRGDIPKATATFEQLVASANQVDRARGKEGLAELAMTQGRLDQAAALADEALQLRPSSSAALLVKAKIAHSKGHTEEVTRLLSGATGGDAVADFSWQEASAMVALGNSLRKAQPVAASASYQAALQVESGNVEALTNLATVLRETGNPQKALDLIKQAQSAPAGGNDRVLQALVYQMTQDVAERRDMDRQKVVDESVRELVARFKEQKAAPALANMDAWTTAPIAISILGFEELTRSLGGRVGMDVLLGQELGRELKSKNVLVVDRALIDKLLAELKLGASSLADPDTQLRLGRLTAARLIAVGRLFSLNGKEYVSFKLIDTETSQIVVNRTEESGPTMDPIAMSTRLAQIAASEITAKYPVKGRLVTTNDEIIVNLGKRNGVSTGDTFKVFGEGSPIEFNGKVIGQREAPLGILRIASVDEQMAVAVPVSKTGNWIPNLRIVDTRAPSSR